MTTPHTKEELQEEFRKLLERHDRAVYNAESGEVVGLNPYINKLLQLFQETALSCVPEEEYPVSAAVIHVRNGMVDQNELPLQHNSGYNQATKKFKANIMNAPYKDYEIRIDSKRYSTRAGMTSEVFDAFELEEVVISGVRFVREDRV